MDRESLSVLYERAGSVSALARALGFCDATVRKMLRENNVPIKRSGYMAPKTVRHYGTEHHNWKGGTWRHSAGYIYEYAPDHPAASDGYVLQHRLVMERHLGRYLTEDETVHHINGDKADNRIENLQLTPHNAHMSHHKSEAARDWHGRFTAKEGSTTIIGAARKG